MPLKGCGYRWIAKRRMISRQKKEHKEKAIQDMHELRQKIFGEIVPAGLRKQAMAEIRLQAKGQAMGFRQQPRNSFSLQGSFSHEVVHSLGPPDFLMAPNSKLMKNS